MPANSSTPTLPAVSRARHNEFVPAPVDLYAARRFPADIEMEREPVQLSHYFWLLRRHRWRILSFVAVCVVATLIVSKRLTPIYESTVTIDVDRHVPTGIIGQDAARSTLNDADQFLATQVRLIQSDAVLRPVAEKYHLRETGGEEEDDAASGRSADAPVALKQLKVARPPNTYLLLVSYRSKNRELAADVANAVAHSYVEHTYNIRFQSSASLTSFMERQLDELKAKMERSHGALAQFEKELNVINPAEKTNILSARLLQLNTDYTNAQTDRVRKEVAFRSVSGGAPAAAQVSTQGEPMRRVRERLEEAQEKFAQVRAHYGPNHPEYRKMEAQTQQIQKQYDEARADVLGRVEVEFRQASNREGMLKSAVAATKAEFDRINARSYEYDALKHEAEADRKLYEELVARIREAGINSGFQSSMVRIADRARPGMRPVFPDIPLNLLLAAIGSMLVAVGIAVIGDIVDSTVRDPADVTSLFGTPVLGSLPAVNAARAKFTCPVAPGGLLPAGRANSSFEDAVRTLRNSILLSQVDRPVKSLMITSALPGEGKTSTALHLAIAHAQQGHKTLLIDGDLRRPSLHTRLGITPEEGLSGALRNGLAWRGSVVPVSGISNLDFLAAGNGSRRATDLIGPALAEILAQAAADYNMVIVDAPPLLGFPEPLEMAASVDAILVVSLAGETTRKAIASALSSLDRVKAHVAGLVLNKVTKDLSDSYRYYGYYSKYYNRDTSADQQVA